MTVQEKLGDSTGAINAVSLKRMESLCMTSNASTDVHSHRRRPQRKNFSMQIVILAILAFSQSCNGSEQPITVSKQQYQNGLLLETHWHDELGISSHRLSHRNMFSFLGRDRSNVIVGQDADADDDGDSDSEGDESVAPLNEATNDSSQSESPPEINENSVELKPVRSFTNYTKCAWYTLSHYIPPDSMLYDGIEGFLIAILVCLILATCYNYCYYCCLTRCGCLPDDRVLKSMLNRKARKRNIKKRSKADGGGCCGCCRGPGRRNADGKGAFTLLMTDNVDSDSDDCDDHSSVSLDPSLEYGDEHLHNEYGEITSRWDDSKIEAAAREYFAREEKEAEGGKKNKSNKIDAMLSKGKSRKKKGSRRSTRSGRSRKTRSKRSTARSEMSSILSSSSDASLSSVASSSSGSEDALEMEAAMMDLELVKRSIAEKGYV